MLICRNSLASSSSVMQAYFANQSCDPFTAQEQPCLLGNYVNYAVNASSSADVVAAINFARNRNIRFVIRNTGHEYVFTITPVCQACNHSYTDYIPAAS